MRQKDRKFRLECKYINQSVKIGFHIGISNHNLDILNHVLQRYTPIDGNPVKNFDQKIGSLAQFSGFTFLPYPV